VAFLTEIPCGDDSRHSGPNHGDVEFIRHFGQAGLMRYIQNAMVGLLETKIVGLQYLIFFPQGSYEGL
jgi:hypothetical protein